MIPAPTCIVCDETNHLRQCGLYGGASISPAYVCAAHDDPPRTICTGCDDAFRHPAETLTAAVVTFADGETRPELYCLYCCEQTIYAHRSGDVTHWQFDGPFTVAMMEDGPQ